LTLHLTPTVDRALPAKNSRSCQWPAGAWPTPFLGRVGGAASSPCRRRSHWCADRGRLSSSRSGSCASAD